MTKQKLLNGIILAFSVIFVRFIDVRIYNMHVVLVILLIVALTAGLSKLAARLPSLEEPVARRSAIAINFAVLLALVLSFFALEL
ncbi:hypothetical protein [Planomicrobium sp. CPCC 101110]|uniref:hypothetical protein n=1 Tax=Planomicrobium sp. CPCC 101110 TaxID=2599619 RepID=UPI0011B39D00|nr:hypothetical protein [Planomicrobium sp. CPCC 101110]TWT24703.1 hypothetical protein FQV30_14480 [Planomicrobium sp. CPCC 101110]